MPLHILSCLVVLGHFQHSKDLQLEMVRGGIVQNRVILLWTNAPSYALAHNYCYCHAYLSFSRFNFCLLWCHLRQKKIWKIIRRRGLAVWWKMFWKIIMNIWRVSSQNAFYPFWSIWDIWDLSCWNIKKIIRKFVILLIITSKIFLYI